MSTLADCNAVSNNGYGTPPSLWRRSGSKCSRWTSRRQWMDPPSEKGHCIFSRIINSFFKWVNTPMCFFFNCLFELDIGPTFKRINCEKLITLLYYYIFLMLWTSIFWISIISLSFSWLMFSSIYAFLDQINMDLCRYSNTATGIYIYNIYIPNA